MAQLGQPGCRSRPTRSLPLSRVRLPAGTNRLALELARTSQPLGAYVAVKADTGKHWHQEFFDGDLRWLDTPWPA
jgi:hypothetical protein